MRASISRWGFWSVSSLLGGLACSGSVVNDVGSLNSHAGSGGLSAGGSTFGKGAGAGATGIGTAGQANNGGRDGLPPSDGGDGGSGGEPDFSYGGQLDTGFGDGGFGGEPDSGTLVCPTCEVVASNQDVRGVTSNAEKVYWVDYGTKDHFGNYNGDGRILVHDSKGGGVTRVLASALPGPESIAISDRYAYVFVDQREDPNNPMGVMRVPLSGGTVQLVQVLRPADYSTYQVFAFANGKTYWNWAGNVYRVTDVDNSTAKEFDGSSVVSAISSDGSLIYEALTDGSFISRPAVADNALAPTELSSQSYGLLVEGGYIYGQQQADPHSTTESGLWLTRIPKTGGTWKRVATSATGWWNLAVNGDTFITDEPLWNGASETVAMQILQRSIATPTTQVTLASEPSVPDLVTWKAFALSSAGVFFADEHDLYLVPLVAP